MIWAAIILGLGGSLHCAAMCGPLVFSVQHNLGIRGVSIPLILYHMGRIGGYLVLGLLFSLIRVPLHLFHLQQYIALISGILLLLFVFKNRIPPVRSLLDKTSSALSKAMSGQYGRQSRLPVVGFLNGLLPCGLSYAAAAVSVGQTGLNNQLLFMLFFGLGTLPMFLIGSWVGSKLSFFQLKSINRYLRYSMMIAGVLLVLRGSGLNIPYVSPDMAPDSDKVECCHK